MTERARGDGRTGIRALAHHLGISIGTVSRALNGRSDVSEETRRRVLEAARDLAYSPNFSGRSLRKGRTNAVGVMWRIADGHATLGEPFFVGLFDGIQERLKQDDCDLVVLVSQENDERDHLRRVVDRGMVDALILPWTRTHDPRLDDVAARRFPFVTLGRSRSGGPHDWLDLDFETAARQATDRLARLGHRRIGLVTAGSDLMQGRIFLDGHRAALAEAGLPFDPALVTAANLTEAGGYEATGRLLQAGGPAPTAILLINEQMTLGAYRAIQELGRRVGEDVAIVGGVMDSALCRLLTPSLTCFSLSPFDLGHRLAEITLARLKRDEPGGQAEDGTDGEPAPLHQELWPLELIGRESDRPK